MPRKATREDVVKKFVEVHGDLYDYSKIVYKGSSEKVEIVCKVHGSFWQSVTHHKSGHGCDTCGREKGVGKRTMSYEDFLQQAKSKHGAKFTYPDQRESFEGSTSVVTITCTEHGEFEQVACVHVRSQHCCPKCSRVSQAKKRTQLVEAFIGRAVVVHGDRYDYTHVTTGKTSEPVQIICKEHGAFLQRPASHLKGSGCPTCANVTIGDKKRRSFESFVLQAAKQHMYKFDYSEAEYVDISTPIKIVCPDHGTFIQKPTVHLVSVYGCPECTNAAIGPRTQKTTEEFVAEARKVHGDEFDYSKSVYTTCVSQLEVICKKHGSFFPTPNNHVGKRTKCPQCKNPTTKIELSVRGWYPEAEYSNRTILKGKELDVYFPNDKVAVELNGRYWHSESNGKGINYHYNKTSDCAKQGITLLQFWENEVEDTPEIVKSMIDSRLGKCNRIFAKDCSIIEVPSGVARDFLNNNHLQGFRQSTFRLGLWYKNSLVSMMTFSVPRFTDKYQFELVRFCSVIGSTIVGGASKLFKHFIKNFNPASVVTYANLRYSNGNVYEKIGFRLDHQSPPSYFYTDSNVNISRYEAQKHKLPKLLGERFNEGLTESENMVNCGYHKVYDCGNKVFTWFSTQE